MNICGINLFEGEKYRRIQNQLKVIQEIFLVNKNNKFIYLDRNVQDDDYEKYDVFVTCGDVKIALDQNLIDIFLKLQSSKKPRLIRDVTYLRIIPKLTKLDINQYPRFSWNSILPNKMNFPFDSKYDRWQEIKKKYNLVVKDYKPKGDKILFLLQNPTDSSLNVLNFYQDGYLNFMIKTINEIFKFTDRQIVLRGHPMNSNNDVVLNYLLKKFLKSNRLIVSKNNNLEDDLRDNIRCVISYNSSGSVEALFHGVNVINLSEANPCFTAASNKLSDIENLKNLDREDFLKKIAFLHWENEELKSEITRKYLSNLLTESIPKS